MRIYFAGDHAGFELKKELTAFARSLGHEVEDLGPFSYDAEDDYTDYVIPLAIIIAKTRNAAERSQPQYQSEARYGAQHGTGAEIRGIVIAGSGQGEIIAMNRIRGARAALFCPCNTELLKASRDHNDSNILAIGARFSTLDEAKQAVKVWLETPFSGDERHLRRLRKIEELTKP